MHRRLARRGLKGALIGAARLFDVAERLEGDAEIVVKLGPARRADERGLVMRNGGFGALEREQCIAEMACPSASSGLIASARS
jgi:hypothetical protein